MQAAGTYLVTGQFSQLHTGSTDVHVYINGVSAFDGISTTAPAFSVARALNAGTTIDFIVGPNGDIGGDSTGLYANISAVPEPASMTLLGAGVLGMLGYRLRRKAAAPVVA